VEVITGLIKANVTSRITFQVASQVDSRTVIDTSGAEKLLGFGDLLFISAEIVKPKRIQGVFVSEKEVKKVIEYIVANNKEEERGDISTEMERGEKSCHRIQKGFRLSSSAQAEGRICQGGQACGHA
jgi:S-DNA-T family DNA segregation ATPase FtsK/SpoIIIE